MQRHSLLKSSQRLLHLYSLSIGKVSLQVLSFPLLLLDFVLFARHFVVESLSLSEEELLKVLLELGQSQSLKNLNFFVLSVEQVLVHSYLSPESAMNSG